MKDWIKAIGIIGGVFFILILFHVLWPSEMKVEHNAHFISSARDEAHNILAVFGEKTVLNNQLGEADLRQLNDRGELNKFPIVPVISYEELPENYVYFLTRIENRNFFDFGKDNVYGMSLSGIARFFKGRADGGSNIPQQLLKNAIHKNEGMGTIYLSRKYGEQLAAFQMMKSASPEKILLAYTNYSGNFWYERDFSGLVLASYAIFNLPPHELNDLEMLLTVRTLKNGAELKALCQERFKNREAIKNRVLNFFKVLAQDNETDMNRLTAMQGMELRFSKRNDLRRTTAITHFLDKNRGEESKHFALQYITSITKDNQRRLQEGVDLFAERFQNQLVYKDYELEIALLAIDIGTGLIEAALGNRKNSGAMANFTDYGAGFQCGSILKPLVFLELFENYDFNENTRLYNGDLEAYTYNPGNVSDRLLNKEVLVRDVLKYSLNKAAVNHRVSSDPLKVARRVEDKLLDMGISPNPSYRLGESYILGTKTMTPREVSQAYQMIFNRGESVPLGPWKYIINPHLQDTIFNGTAKKGSSMYAEVQANKIKALLKGAFETGGTCHGLLQFLPGNRQYYGKTGTTGKAKDGWTIISDGQKLIVVWAGYVKNDNGVLTRKDAPEIPSKSGAGSAGIFAAMVYSKLYD